MSILHYQVGNGCHNQVTNEKRYERDALGDLKHGLDLIFELKEKIDVLHPIATETLIRLVSM